MTAWTSVETVWRRIRARTQAYLANDDPLAAAANAGALLVWSSQPIYPLHLWLLVGSTAALPALLTWLSTPFFFGVPLLARRSSAAGRSLFVIAGVANTLIATKVFGTASGAGWFLMPCLLLIVGFFRRSEWRLAAALGLTAALASLALRLLGPPLQEYSPDAYRSLTRVNLLGAGVLSIYLAYAAYRARRRKRLGT